MDKILFWQKLAKQPEDEDKDHLYTNEVKEDKNIRELIRSLEDKIIGKKRNLLDLSPQNPSVKKWIKEVLSSYPKKEDSRVEDILNEYRSVLNSRSREKEKFVLVALQLNDTFVIAHCKKGPSLAEVEEQVVSVETILNSKNIIRADIIKMEEGILKMLAYEQNRKFSKGHADFWGIEIEDVGWDSLGSICLNIELDALDFPIQVNLDNKELEEMIKAKKVSPSGKIQLGREEGTISKVYVFGKIYEYPKFYDIYVREKEKLDEYKKKFEAIVPISKSEQEILNKYIPVNKYGYIEDSDNLFEEKGDKEELIYRKTHPRYDILFFTKENPIINIKRTLLDSLSDAIFNNLHYEVYHAGEDASEQSFQIGNLAVFNNLELCRNFEQLSLNFINKIQDAESRKLKIALKIAFCHLMKNCIKSKHFTYVFDYLIESLLPEFEYEFKKSDGISTNEDLLEFKSAEEVEKKPTKFALNTLVPTIRKYIDGDNLVRTSIIYGVEDDHSIKPLYHFKNDMITTIEQTTNEKLHSDNITVNVHPIKYKEGTLLLIILTKVK